jgi:hypothetical protein
LAPQVAEMGDVIQTDFGAARDRREVREVLTERIRQQLEFGLPDLADATDGIVRQIESDLDELDSALAQEPLLAELPLAARALVERLRKLAHRRIAGSAYSAVVRIVVMARRPDAPRQQPVRAREPAAVLTLHSAGESSPSPTE